MLPARPGPRPRPQRNPPMHHALLRSFCLLPTALTLLLATGAPRRRTAAARRPRDHRSGGQEGRHLRGHQPRRHGAGAGRRGRAADLDRRAAAEARRAGADRRRQHVRAAAPGDAGARHRPGTGTVAPPRPRAGGAWPGRSGKRRRGCSGDSRTSWPSSNRRCCRAATAPPRPQCACTSCWKRAGPMPRRGGSRRSKSCWSANRAPTRTCAAKRVATRRRSAACWRWPRCSGAASPATIASCCAPRCSTATRTCARRPRRSAGRGCRPTTSPTSPPVSRTRTARSGSAPPRRSVNSATRRRSSCW